MNKNLVVKGNAVGDYKYENQNIENLILEDGLLYIGRCAFRYNNIKKLYLPKSIKKIEAGAFHFNPLTEVIFYNNGAELEGFCFSGNVKKLTIIDCDYEFLFNIFKPKNYSFDHFYNIEEIDIVNDKLSFIEKLKIKHLTSKYPDININILQDINLGEFIKPETSVEDIDNKVNILLSKIYSMINQLDCETKIVIFNKITSLMSEYQTKLKKFKPQFSTKNNSILTIADTSPKALRNNLIFSLEMIIWNLNNKSKMIELSRNVGKAFHYLLGDLLDDEILNDDDEIFLKTKEISDISKLIKEIKYIDELKELLWEIRKITLNNLDDKYVTDLTLRSFDIETYFQEKFDKSYNELMILKDKLDPYLELLKALKGYENDIFITKELSELERIFSELIGKSKEELNDEYKKLKEKYINILEENILKIKENKLDVLLITEIELNFRKELQLILEKLRRLVPNILKNQKLYHQLSIATSETMEKGSIIDLIKEINKLLDNALLSANIKEKIIDKLSHIIIYWKNILSSNDTNEIVKNFSSEVGLTSENLIIEVMILKQLYELKFIVEQYISDSLKYDKAISSAGSISINKLKLFN